MSLAGLQSSLAPTDVVMKKATFNRNPMGIRNSAVECRGYPQNWWTTSQDVSIQQRQPDPMDNLAVCASTPRRTVKLNRRARATHLSGMTCFAPLRVSILSAVPLFSCLLQRQYSCYDPARSKIGMLSCTWLVLLIGLRFLSSNAHYKPVCNHVRFGVICARLGARWAFSFVPSAV